MSLFEYIVASFTILLGLAFARLLHALRYVFKKNKADVTHYALFLTCLCLLALSWWSKWSLSEVDNWSFVKFLLLLLDFGLMYMMCDVIAPSNSENINSWREHIDENINIFFVLLILKWLTTRLGNWYILGHSNYLYFLSAFALCILPVLGLILKKREHIKIISILTFIQFLIIFSFVINRDTIIYK